MNDGHNTSTQQDTQAQHAGATPGSAWAEAVCESINNPGMVNTAADHCEVRCRIIQRYPTLIYPFGLGERNPRMLAWLAALAEKNGLKILQERRHQDVGPIRELRREEAPIMALGVGMLLQKTGLAGSDQLHLSDNRPVRQVTGERFARLFRIASELPRHGKKVTLRANRFLRSSNRPGNVNGYGSRLVKGEEKRTFALFDGDGFHSVGYTQKNGFVFHVFAGGGASDNPQLWGPIRVMTREPLQVRLFHNEDYSEQYGLLYASYGLQQRLPDTNAKSQFWRNLPQPQQKAG
ncbi:hypothetical protein Q4485_08175 [Granulosicoccaceae sp. 1_MG-2023]|nr:hypothetical protein [Granulosicoccaceae sp. 1_MG-2023]